MLPHYGLLEIRFRHLGVHHENWVIWERLVVANGIRPARDIDLTENKMSCCRTRARVAADRRVELIGKLDNTTARGRLHRMVKRDLGNHLMWGYFFWNHDL